MNINEVSKMFLIDGKYVNSSIIKSGHINTTYLVETTAPDKNRLYIFQRINLYVFKDPIKLMDNIVNVTTYIRNKIKETKPTAKRDVLHFYKSINDTYYYITPDNEFYRCYRFIDDSITFDETNNLFVISESGKAFGDFQNYLDSFDVKTLYEIIPDFHNTINRYKLFNDAINNDYGKRVGKTKDEIDKYIELKPFAIKLYQMYLDNLIPLRVTHNDTKCNNVVFDKDTFVHLAVIDLDTVMPGLVGNDFGDAIRFTCNNSKEDEEDLNKVYLDLSKYEAFAKGFIEKTIEKLTINEIKSLSIGAISMTLECGVRFLTDYLDGDKYFSISYPEQNLVRAKCQLKLAMDMISKKDEMDRIIDNIINDKGAK